MNICKSLHIKQFLTRKVHWSTVDSKFSYLLTKLDKDEEMAIDGKSGYECVCFSF